MALPGKRKYAVCKRVIPDYGIYKGAGVCAKCDYQRIGVRAHVRANLNLDV